MDNFYKWGTSFAGCDGGDLEKADTWLCGLEWGTSGTNLEKYYAKIKEEITTGFVDPSLTTKKYDFKEHNTYSFGRSFSKLYSVINNKTISNYRTFTESLSGEQIFKLNLYPVAFNNFSNDLWNVNNMSSILGNFETKDTYKLWCKLNRFPVFKKVLNNKSKHGLKRVICIGLSNLDDFIDAFYISSDERNDLIESVTIKNENITQKDRRIFKSRMSNGVYFYVLPFPTSAMGLNSDFLLRKVGEEIRQFEDTERP